MYEGQTGGDPLAADTDSTVVELQTPVCVHHWILDAPDAGAVIGRCKRCRTDRLFSASPEGFERFDDYRELTQTTSYYGEKNSA